MPEILDPTSLNDITSNALLAVIVIYVIYFISWRWYPDQSRRKDMEIEADEAVRLARVDKEKEARLLELEIFRQEFTTFQQSIHRRLDKTESWIQTAIADND